MGSGLLRADLDEVLVDPDEARRVVDEVLARPEYAEARPGLLERFLGWLGDLFEGLVGALGGTGAGTLAAWIILAAVLGVVTWLLVRFLRRMQRSPSLPQAFAGDAGRSPRAWSAEADEHEAGGRWREAIRCHYRALIAELSSAGELEEVPGRTAHEYLVMARRRPRPWLEPLERATGIFEPAWYSEQPVGPRDVDAIKQARSDAGTTSARRHTEHAR